MILNLKAVVAFLLMATIRADSDDNGFPANESGVIVRAPEGNPSDGSSIYEIEDMETIPGLVAVNETDSDSDDGGDTNDDNVYEGTDGQDVWYDEAGDQTYKGGDDYDQVNYRGALSDYRLEKQDDGSITVTHASGEVDTLIDIEGLWFNGEAEWYSTDYAVEESDAG